MMTTAATSPPIHTAGLILLSAASAAGAAASAPATASANEPKKSFAIFFAVASISREPIWANLPPTAALAV